MLDSKSEAESSAITVTGGLVALSSAVVVEVETDGAGFVLLLRMVVNFPLLRLVFGIAVHGERYLELRVYIYACAFN